MNDNFNVTFDKDGKGEMAMRKIANLWNDRTADFKITVLLCGIMIADILIAASVCGFILAAAAMFAGHECTLEVPSLILRCS